MKFGLLQQIRHPLSVRETPSVSLSVERIPYNQE